MNVLLNIVFLILYGIWQLFSFFGLLVKKVFLDVLTGVYGKFVALFSRIIFLAVIAALIGPLILYRAL